MSEWNWLLLACGIAVPVYWSIHWLPRTMNPEVELYFRRHWTELIGRYVIGVGVILVLFSGFRLAVGDWKTPVQLLAIVAASGVAVVLSYLYDKAIDTAKKAQMAERNDDELK